MSAFIRPDLLAFAAYSTHAPEPVEHQPDPIDHLDANECAYDLPVELKEKLTWQYLNEVSTNRYPDSDQAALKAAIAHYATAAAALSPPSATPEHISVGNGSDELIRSLLIATCLGRPGAILVAAPTFSMYAILAKTLGIPVVTVDRHPETFEVNLEAAQAAIDNPQEPIRMVFMVSPNSPTGNGLTAAELTWLRQLPDDVLVVVDEAYFEFSQQTTLPEALSRPNWLVTRTFSKAFRLAAHRVGYAIARPEVIQILEKVRLPYNLPSVSQAAARLALTHAPAILEKVKEVQAERDRLSQQLKGLPNFKVWPSDANFLYARPTQADMSSLFQTLRREGTYIRLTGGGLRITVGTPAENNRTLAHLRECL